MSSGQLSNSGALSARLDRFAEYVRGQRRRSLVLILGAPVLALLTFFVLPLLSMLWLSLHTETGASGEFTLANYQQLIASTTYLEILQTTLVLTVETTVIVTVVGYVLAYGIVRLSTRTNLLLLLVILPFWTNYIIRMYAWINILQPGGALGSVLMSLGLLAEPTGFLYNRAAVLVGFVYVWLPLAVLPFYASLNNLDEDLIEAAMDLGSGPIKTFFTVTLPLTKGGIIAGITLVAIPTFGSFITPVLLGGTNVTMLGVVIERQFNEAFNWPLGSALGMVVTAFVILMLILSTRLGADLMSTEGEAQ
jgi:spermidine/putrescine transport system permease protein